MTGRDGERCEGSEGDSHDAPPAGVLSNRPALLDGRDELVNEEAFERGVPFVLVPAVDGKNEDEEEGRELS